MTQGGNSRQSCSLPPAPHQGCTSRGSGWETSGRHRSCPASASRLQLGKPNGGSPFIFYSYVELTWTSTRTIHLKCPVQQIRIGTLSLGPLVLVVCLLLLLMKVASSSSSFHSSLFERSCSNIDGNRVLVPRRDSTATHLSPPGDLLPTPPCLQLGRFGCKLSSELISCSRTRESFRGCTRWRGAPGRRSRPSSHGPRTWQRRDQWHLH